MQELLDYYPEPPEKLSGVTFVEKTEEKLKSLATLRMGSAKPSDIQNGELWQKQLPNGKSEFRVWKTEDESREGTLIQDFFKTTEIFLDSPSDDKLPTEKAVSVFLNSKIDKSAISSAIDSVSEETVASSKAVSGLRNVLSDSFISGLGMPNLNKKIFIQFSPINNDKIDYSAAYTAPANGWVTVYGKVANTASKAYALVFAQSGDILMTSASGTADVLCTATIPVNKGFGIYLKTQSCWSVGAYFFYAQGES